MTACLGQERQREDVHVVRTEAETGGEAATGGGGAKDYRRSHQEPDPPSELQEGPGPRTPPALGENELLLLWATQLVALCHVTPSVRADESCRPRFRTPGGSRRGRCFGDTGHMPGAWGTGPGAGLTGGAGRRAPRAAGSDRGPRLTLTSGLLGSGGAAKASGGGNGERRGPRPNPRKHFREWTARSLAKPQGLSGVSSGQESPALEGLWGKGMPHQPQQEGGKATEPAHSPPHSPPRPTPAGGQPETCFPTRERAWVRPASRTGLSGPACAVTPGWGLKQHRSANQPAYGCTRWDAEGLPPTVRDGCRVHAGLAPPTKPLPPSTVSD